MNSKYDNLKKIGSGSLSDVFLLDRSSVLIVGKREDCFLNYQKLYEKSMLINGKITTIQYPKIKELIAPCKQFPFGAMTESHIDGVELKKCISFLSAENKIQIGKKLAEFLNQLHSIEVQGNKQNEININIQKFEKSVTLLSEYLSKEYLQKINVVKQKYLRFMQSKDFCLTHGDLNAGNILISKDGNIAGVIDFGNMEYYVPEVEFAHMYFFDQTIYEGMVQSYNNEIKKEDVILVELVMRIRHFKNIVKFEDKRKQCLNNIITLLLEFDCKR